MADRDKTILVVSHSVDGDKYIFDEHEEKLVRMRINVGFEIREILDMREENSWSTEAFRGYKGLLVHPGQSEQNKALGKLKKLEGVRWALYTIDIRDSMLLEGGARMFDITDLDGIVSYFIGEQK